MNEKIIKTIDGYIGAPLCIFLWIINKVLKRKAWGRNKILVIMFWGIGSNINSLPAVKLLKTKFPKAKIDILAPKKNKDLFYNNKNINKLIDIDLSLFSLVTLLFRLRNKYDIVIDMEHWLNISSIISFFTGKKRIGFKNRFRSLLYDKKVIFNKHLHAVYNNLNLLKPLNIKYKNIENLEKLNIRKQDNLFVNNLLRENNINKNNLIIGVCPGSGETVKARRWPKNNFILLINKIISFYDNKNIKIFLFGTKEEEDLISYIQNKVKTKTYNTISFTLSQTIALINKLSLMISNDTGPMHIAAAQGIKTIGLFGPETPEIFAPFGKNNISLFKKIHCSPCIKIYKGRHINCQDNICMKKISVDDVFDVVSNFF
jgi:heptosyltransferase-2